MTPTLAFLSLPGFVVPQEHIKSEAAQLEGFPLPPRCLQGFCSASQRSGMFSHFPSFCVAAPENISVVPCVEGGEWNFVNCVFGVNWLMLIIMVTLGPFSSLLAAPTFFF